MNLSITNLPIKTPTEILGIKSVTHGWSSIKRDLLLFDQIGVIGLPFSREQNAHISNLDDIYWLMEQGAVLDTTQLPVKFTVSSEEVGYLSPRELEPSDIFARLTSIVIRRDLSWNVVPLLLNTLPSSQVQERKSSSIISIVLNNMPIPDEMTSWEDIMQFRSDPNSFHKFLDLRNWMSEVAQGQLSPIEIEQKLEYLMSQYQRHMELHKMKTNASILETVVVSSAEFLEDLMKVRWGKIAKGLFSFRQKKVAMLEGELTSPGSEVAYIVKAREVFE